MLQEPDNDIVLVDVRSPDEQNLSVLPGNVIRKDAFDTHKGDYHNNRIVTYWSVNCLVGKTSLALLCCCNIYRKA